LFIIGIALAMAFPAGPAWVAPAWWGTAALGAASVAVLVLLRKHRPPTEDLSPWGEEFRFDKWHAAAWVVLAATALVFGYARYLSMIQSPDRLLGTADLSAAREWKGREMTTTSFLKLKVLDDVAEETSLRISGELEALRPMLDGSGVPLMDENGNWNFEQTDTDQESEEITLAAGTRAGTEILIDQPFTRVEKVETVKAPKGRVRVAVYQPVNTVALFARRGRNTVPVKILGKIAADPWVYSFKTVLSVAPDYLQYRPGGTYLKVERQTVRVTVDPEVPAYASIARSDAYGYDVAVSGQLIAPNGAANAGSFDQAKYLRNYNIGGQMSLKGGGEGGMPLDIVIPQGSELPREGNGLVEFSLYLRDSMVRVIKQTMPQPNSAFLGALTLGLRYGMQNTVTIASDDYQDGAVKPLLDLGEGDNDDLIADEFRASGINHVLAVSGLHVTIITVMFMGIFTLLKISKKVYVPFVIFALTVFAIITGARPSTLRAVIMNSLFLLTWGYMGQGVRASALLGVPVAAFMILVQNPAMAVDPSFTLSFGAILSLALLTQPFFDIFKKFEGNNFVALCGVLAVLTYAFAAHWLLVATLRFWVFLAVVAAGLFAGARWLDKKNIHLIGNFGFADIPVGVSGFIAAQFGMQVGMMIPLSAYYFARWPVAGAYANLLAIPLVGVVLQLSMLAGLIGLIPGIGIYVALLLNAANWVFSTGFLYIGHYFAKWFTYPFVRKPTLAWIFAYYAALAVFIWWRPLWFRTLRPKWRHWGNAMKFLCIVAACAVVGGVVWGLEEQKRGLAPEGVAEINVLSVGYGSAVLLRTPDGRFVLVDTGFVQTDRGRRNEADRTILPFMSANRALRLDGVVVTGPGREHTDGLATVLEHCKIDTLYYPASAAPVLEEGEVADVLRERDASRVKHALGGTGLKKAMISAGDRLFESEGPDGKLFYVEVLGPRGGDGQAPATLRVVYGDFAMLLCGDLTMDQQQALLRECADGQLRAQVVTAPAHGTAGLERVNAGMPKNYARDLEQVTGALLKKTGAEAVVFEFGNPRPACGEKYKLAVKLHGAAKRAAEDALPEARIMATDLDGGVRIATDGKDWTLSAQFDGDGSDTDAPTSLEVGW
jgi:ComEC/Rec2-related protein